ncbi:uncharacterized protein [Haliotis cracherodii]|uniref:uncharacterized protein n=1 Tax=Haliotis cracherodii TaxID=6455 RepID=UPI0039EB7152
MRWISVVTGVGVYAWVHFCLAVRMDICKEGDVRAPNITLTIDLTSFTNCCCHFRFRRNQAVWRNMTVGCGIKLVHNASYLGKNCTSRGAFSQPVKLGETALDLCVVREGGHIQNEARNGELILTTTMQDIGVNCSGAITMDASTYSTQPDRTKVDTTTEKSPGNKVTLWIIIPCVVGGGVLVTITVCSLCVYRRRRRRNKQAHIHQGCADTGTPVDDDDLVMSDNSLYGDIHVASSVPDNATNI